MQAMDVPSCSAFSPISSDLFTILLTILSATCSLVGLDGVTARRICFISTCLSGLIFFSSIDEIPNPPPASPRDIISAKSIVRSKCWLLVWVETKGLAKGERALGGVEAAVMAMADEGGGVEGGASGVVAAPGSPSMMVPRIPRTNFSETLAASWMMMIESMLMSLMLVSNSFWGIWGVMSDQDDWDEVGEGRKGPDAIDSGDQDGGRVAWSLVESAGEVVVEEEEGWWTRVREVRGV